MPHLANKHARLTARVTGGLAVTNNDKVYTAIVLQGDGALGAYEYGVLKALYEKRPGFTPVAVTSISIGAVTAAVLGGAKSDPDAVREVIVIELFRMNAQVPRSLLDVLQRMVQLQYTSWLKLDKHFFDKVDSFVDLVAMLETTLPKTSPVRDDPIYKDMLTYRKINHFNVVTSTIPANLTTAADFSRSSIEARINAGYHDAVAQGIGDVDAPGLRFGVSVP